MNTNKHLLKILAALFIFIFSSCHNLFKDDDENPEPIYLVSYEFMGSFPFTIVEAMFSKLVTDYPEIEEFQERVKYGFIVYKITYKTTFEGEPIIASGLVSAPISEGPFPVLSYQNGTNTLHGDAPSVNPNRNLYVLLEIVASTGLVIALPDYLGFGSTNNMFHPYLHAGSTVPVVLDMLRAVEELGELRGFSVTNDLYLTGYSMGGWATMQVQKEIETNHSNEFNLKASAPSAGPYDLNFMNEHILKQETYPMPYYMGYVYNSYENLGIVNTPLEQIFNAPYDSRVAELYDGSLSGEEINAQLTTDMSELFTEEYMLNYDTNAAYSSIIEALEANSSEAWNATTPTHIIHSTGDDLVPFQVSQNMYQQLSESSNQSTDIKLIPLPDYNHVDGIIPAGLYAIQWFFEIMDK